MSEKKAGERRTFQENAEARRVAEFVAQTMTTRCCLCRWNSGELPSSEAHAAFEVHLAKAHPEFEPREPTRRRRGGKSRSQRPSRSSERTGRVQAKA